MRGLFRRPVVVAALVALLVAILGGAATRIGPWYEALEKPSWNPPDWAFAPVWTAIYALAVYAAVKGWRASRTSRDRFWLLSLFFINAVLNVLWSALFFTLRRPDWALAEAATLFVSVLVLLVFLLPRERQAAIAMGPYLLWVGFAAVLNYRIVMLNAPFS